MRIRVEFPPVWATVRRLREAIMALMGNSAPELVHSVVLAAAELGENVVKYGEEVPGIGESTVDVEARDGYVRIVTVNGVVEQHNVDSVRAIIEQLKSCDDPRAVYANALSEILAWSTDDEPSRHPEPRIGLLRVGAEAGFELDSHYDPDGRLTIVATRRL